MHVLIFYAPPIKFKAACNIFRKSRWSGFSCKLVFFYLSERDKCEPNRCKNGGTCVDLYHSFRCECISGYSGYQCQEGRMTERGNDRRAVKG